MEGRRGEVKAVSFKLPLATWQAIHDHAAAIGLDVGSVLNWMIAEKLPCVLRHSARREESMRLARQQGFIDAVKDRLETMAVESGPDAAAQVAAELVRRLDNKGENG